MSEEQPAYGEGVSPQQPPQFLACQQCGKPLTVHTLINAATGQLTPVPLCQSDGCPGNPWGQPRIVPARLGPTPVPVRLK